MKLLTFVFSLLLVAGCAAPSAQNPPSGMPAQLAAPEIRAGHSWTYAAHDGYTKLPLGTHEYRVQSVQGDIVTVKATHSGREATELYTRDWNWRERPMTNLQNFRYEPAYAALPFPLAAGKTWRAHVKATDPVTGKANSVRIDGTVQGWERVKVPAGEFDAIKVRRVVYAGNPDYFKTQEYIVETDWYSPHLGRVVRSESTSGHYDFRRSCEDGNGCLWTQNDWSVAELVSHGK